MGIDDTVSFARTSPLRDGLTWVNTSSRIVYFTSTTLHFVKPTVLWLGQIRFKATPKHSIWLTNLGGWQAASQCYSQRNPLVTYANLESHRFEKDWRHRLSHRLWRRRIKSILNSWSANVFTFWLTICLFFSVEHLGTVIATMVSRPSGIYSVYIISRSGGLIFNYDIESNYPSTEVEKTFSYPLDVKLEYANQRISVMFGQRDNIKGTLFDVIFF